MRLNFYCIGSSKCGTSSLHDILAQHPNVFLPKVKETKFLSLNYNNGLDWYYNEYYKSFVQEKLVGEIYPCLALNEAPERLLESFGPDLKLFVVLRHPVKRLYSNFQGQERISNINIPFKQAIVERPVLVENSLYAKHLKRFFEKFPKENFEFFLFEEDFIKNRKKMMTSLCNFLEIEDFEFNLDLKSNATWEPKSKLLNRLIYKRPQIISNAFNKILKSKQLKQRIRVFLSRVNAKPVASKSLEFEQEKQLFNTYFKSDVKELEALINRDLSQWYNLYDQ